MKLSLGVDGVRVTIEADEYIRTLDNSKKEQSAYQKGVDDYRSLQKAHLFDLVAKVESGEITKEKLFDIIKSMVKLGGEE